MLIHLHDRLASAPHGRATAIAGKAVHGLGGVGKTRLAVEYAWRYAVEHSALLFVGAQWPADLRRNIAALCERSVLDLQEKDATEEEIREAAALNWLREHSDWLLILDNVDSEDAATAVDGLVAQLSGGQVLLTGRLARWSAEVESIELDVLAEGDAVTFLLERTQKRRRKTKDDEGRAVELARELGFLPLALEQAGAYIAERRRTFAAYLEEWWSRHDAVLAWFDPRVSHYPASVAVTWKTSFDQLDPPARRLLERLSWLGPEPIPEMLLDLAVPGMEDDPDLRPRDALVVLDAYSLVTRAPEALTFTVHRLVQDVSRRSQWGNSRPLFEMLEWMDSAFKGDPQDIYTRLTLDSLAPHAQVVVAFADASGITAPTSRLMNNLAQLLDVKAIFGEAEPLLLRALAIDEKSLGPDHPGLAVRFNNLAYLLKTTNRFTAAEGLFRRALSIDEDSLGLDDPEVATDLNNLAQLLQDTNRLSEAEPLMHRALEIDVKYFGSDHPNVAIRLNNLALLFQATNRLPEAVSLMVRTLVIVENQLEWNHPKVTVVLSNLAHLFHLTHRFSEAEPLMRRALAIDEQGFGSDHPSISIHLNNLASLLIDTKRFDEAEPLLRRALEIDEKKFGLDHPDVSTALSNLTSTLYATGRPAEAERLIRRALAILLEFGRKTGHEHPNLRTVRANFGGVLEAMGKSPAEVEAAVESLTTEASSRPRGQAR